MNFYPKVPKTIIPILFINFISSLSFSIVLPFLFILVNKYGGNAFVYGLISASYSFFQFIGSPILGTWSDKFGRKPILLLSQFGTFVSWIIFLFAFFFNTTGLIHIKNIIFGIFTLTLPLIAIFFARALDGITGANISVANAYLADITTKESRTKNFGLMAGAANVGFVLGPALAGILGNTYLGLLLPIILALLLSFVGLLLIIFLINKKTNQNNLSNEDSTLKNEKHHLKQLLAIPNFKLTMSMNFIIYLGFNFFYVSFAVYIISTINGTVLDLGLLLSFLSFCLILVEGPLLSQLSSRTSANNLMVVGGLLLSLGFYLIVYNNMYILYTSMLVIAIGDGLLYPSLVATISNLVEQDLQGTIQGYITSTGSMASIIGLLVGGLLYEIISKTIFILSAITILILVCMVFILRIHEKSHSLNLE